MNSVKYIRSNHGKMLLTLQVKDAHLKPMTLADAESATAAADVESATAAVDVESATAAADVESATAVVDVESATTAVDVECPLLFAMLTVL